MILNDAFGKLKVRDSEFRENYGKGVRSTCPFPPRVRLRQWRARAGGRAGTGKTLLRLVRGMPQDVFRAFSSARSLPFFS